MKQEAYFCRVKELNELGKENIPKQLISHTHLIYSSQRYDQLGKDRLQLPADGRSRNHDHREVHGQWPGIRCGDPEKDGLWPPGELHLLL